MTNPTYINVNNDSEDPIPTIYDEDSHRFQHLKKPSTDTSSLQMNQTSSAAKKSFYNYIIFCFLYSITHATVDAVVSFSTAELGSVLGSYGGFALYITYTLSSLLFAKPFLKSVGAKYALLAGLLGNLCYVGSFFISLSLQASATPVFIIGAILGGVGSGLLWTGQGSYYSLNSIDYSKKSNIMLDKVNIDFASIFSGTYLGLETLFGVMATAMYLALGSDADWKSVIFGSYAMIAVLSVIMFWRYIIPLVNDDHDMNIAVTKDMGVDISDHSSEHDEASDQNGYAMLMKNRDGLSQDMSMSQNPWTDIWEDLSAVSRGLWTMRRLQLITPYQISFGLSSGLMNYYVNGFIVKTYIGDGYIGVLASVSTITATLSALPYAFIANTPSLGKSYIIMFSMLCFCMNGLLVLIFTSRQLGSWWMMVPYFTLHGFARGAWESTNKAMVADYFPGEQQREVAFASIYFTSGLAGAFGYFCYHYMTGFDIAALNTSMAVVAAICYYYSTISSSKQSVIHTSNIN